MAELSFDFGTLCISQSSGGGTDGYLPKNLDLGPCFVNWVKWCAQGYMAGGCGQTHIQGRGSWDIMLEGFNGREWITIDHRGTNGGSQDRQLNDTDNCINPAFVAVNQPIQSIRVHVIASTSQFVENMLCHAWISTISFDVGIERKITTLIRNTGNKDNLFYGTSEADGTIHESDVNIPAGGEGGFYYNKVFFPGKQVLVRSSVYDTRGGRLLDSKERLV